jgi:hypothetical protein
MLAVRSRTTDITRMKLLCTTLALLTVFSLSGTSLSTAGELSVSGTRFLLDGQPFPYIGLSFFNAIYNPNFNASKEARLGWLRKFQAHGVTVLRVWCQWDNARGFVDASPRSTMYYPDGGVRAEHLSTLKAIVGDADELGMCIELVLFSQESFREDIRIDPPADERAVEALTRELRPWRNVTFQIWNEHDDQRVLPLVRLVKSLDPKRLVTNSPGYAGDLGTDEENRVLDYLTPHTSRQSSGTRHWEKAAREVQLLLEKFAKPIVDDEPARTGTNNFGGPREQTHPMDHILAIYNVWRVGGYPTYHHDMFQTGYGSAAVPPSGIPDPDFSPYHQQVFRFLQMRARYAPK